MKELALLRWLAGWQIGSRQSLLLLGQLMREVQQDGWKQG
jgi:hypothetical protein